MDRYLIETPHTAEECQRLIKQVHAMGYLQNFDWGCEVGVHCGWAVVEAESEAIAEQAVPLMVRPRARVIRVVKYGPGKASETHSG